MDVVLEDVGGFWPFGVFSFAEPRIPKDSLCCVAMMWYGFEAFRSDLGFGKSLLPGFGFFGGTIVNKLYGIRRIAE